MAETTIEKLSQLSVHCEDKENKNVNELSLNNIGNDNNYNSNSDNNNNDNGNNNNNNNNGNAIEKGPSEPSESTTTNNNNNDNNNNNNNSEHIETKKRRNRLYATIHLLNKDGTDRGSYDMKKPKITIGSDSDQSEIFITRPGVYPRHVEIIFDKKKKKFYLVPLIDPKISDTVRINFVPFIYKKEELGDGDIISVGFRSIRIDFQVQTESENLVQPEAPYSFNINNFINNGGKRISIIAKRPVNNNNNNNNNNNENENENDNGSNSASTNNNKSIQPQQSRNINSNVTNTAPATSTNKPIGMTTTSTSTSTVSNNKSTKSSTTVPQIKDTRNHSQDVLKQLNSNREVHLATKQKDVLKKIMNSNSNTDKKKSSINDDDYADDLSDGEYKNNNNNNNNVESEKEEEEDSEKEEKDCEKEKEENNDEQKDNYEHNEKQIKKVQKNQQADHDNRDIKPITPNKNELKDLGLSKLVKKNDSTRWLNTVQGTTRHRTQNNHYTPNIQNEYKTSKPKKIVEQTTTITTTTTTTTTKGKSNKSTSSSEKENKVKKVPQQQEHTNDEQHGDDNDEQQHDEDLQKNQDTEFGSQVNFFKPISFTKAKNIISSFRKSSEKPFTTQDFENLDQQKQNIKKSLDYASSFNWKNQKDVLSLQHYFASIPNIESYASEFLREYYSIIQHPISILAILNKLKEPKYSFSLFLQDFDQILKNALEINQTESEVIWTYYNFKLKLFEKLYQLSLIKQIDYEKCYKDCSRHIKTIESKLGAFSPKLMDNQTIIESTNKAVDKNVSSSLKQKPAKKTTIEIKEEQHQEENDEEDEEDEEDEKDDQDEEEDEKDEEDEEDEKDQKDDSNEYEYEMNEDEDVEIEDDESCGERDEIDEDIEDE